ncbi:ligase-associated DNA damage response DEXH box helicase [Lysobacter sp. TY2-98]|uniref:ligase-associated DNA damage response DEXH box helicase n=1 Tax=Lysobacter sp. TY2-98 TaxID=2290922 RepID=UPI000E20B799|nr:ligase-associated DNA damage response DEXH box helicase [Lysobacter sp. TY2-98]AXK71834.1 ligase-associated DNA damage response DEXH box helicase [Lysobacter sp. TY2-98]
MSGWLLKGLAPPEGEDPYAAYPERPDPTAPRQTVESIRRDRSRRAAAERRRAEAAARAERLREQQRRAADADPICALEGVVDVDAQPHAARHAPTGDPEQVLADWFDRRGWSPAPFQREVWTRYLRGESGLLHTPTGSGKTLAAFGGPLIEAISDMQRGAARTSDERELKVLWITPLRALAADTLRALREPADALGLDWSIGLRTGDASARDKKLARDGHLDALVTTPESLALLLSYPETAARLTSLRGVVVDEWHELLGTKRGVLLQLCLARLRAMSPTLRIWGLSATLGNLDEARDVLVPHAPESVVVSGATPRAVTLETLVPEAGERFPWAGHLGLAQLSRVAERIFEARTSLLFTNTRAFAELWHQALQAVWPEDLSTLALHHGSLDPHLRAEAEAGLRDGSVRCVVATSSLDLGVDFPAVDQVFQLGSPKGTARLLQRAGRAKHRPGESGHVVCVPTHMLEMVEFAAVRDAVAAGEVEARRPPRLSLDVLAQHCVTLALGGGFDADELLREVRGTHAFAGLADEAWQSVLDFIVQGGRALEHYPDFQRVVRDECGRYVVHDRRVALRHRLSIGTITSEGSVAVRLVRGGTLGAVEEVFVARLKPGDRFLFSGRMLELVRMEAMTALVKRAPAGEGMVPQWTGIRQPLSMELSARVERLLARPLDVPEMRAVAGLLELQSRISSLPRAGQLLVEWTKTREGPQLFVFPFAGRLANEGLAALLSLRWGRVEPNTFGYAANDYGFVLKPTRELHVEEALLHELMSPERLFEDLRESLNLGELARRQFRDIARIAGLLPPTVPGRPQKSMRQLQASSGLLYDVLQRYDPHHMLLELAEREVFAGQLEVQRLQRVLDDCASRDVMLLRPRGLTPLSFPLWAEGIRGHLSTEDWKTRVQRAAARLEKRHGR